MVAAIKVCSYSVQSAPDKYNNNNFNFNLIIIIVIIIIIIIIIIVDVIREMNTIAVLVWFCVKLCPWAGIIIIIIICYD